MRRHLSLIHCRQLARAAGIRRKCDDTRHHQAVRVTPSTYSVMLAPVFAMSI